MFTSVPDLCSILLSCFEHDSSILTVISNNSSKSTISNGSGDMDQKSNFSGIKIHHLTSSAGLGHSRFPKLEECAHFHYEHVELSSLQLLLYEEEDLKSLSSLEHNENTENKWLTVKVVSQGHNWLLRRTYENFRVLDQQLHQCIYDRKFSQLSELPPLQNLPDKQNPQAYIKSQLNKYCERFSNIAGNLINCGPVLSWFELDNRGRRILVTDGDSCPINTPAVAAAYAVQKYSAKAADEISFDVGDMISVIDMPPPEDSVWWRGKRGFMVGFFPSQCVAVITDKVPHNLQLHQHATIVEPSKPVLRKHGKLIAFFRAFILSRPSKRHLKQSGILKERVFGCDLGEHLLNSGREVPMVLKCCSEFIEKHGIVDGIYRLSGATSNIQKLRTTFDEDRVPALYNDDSILQDIHSVASLLKMYFRELPNPLCTYQLYKNFVNAVQNADPADRVASMRDVVQKLPPPHFRTLEFLMRHLSRVAEHGTRTGMTARNIAIVWAPNLLRCKELEVGGVAALQGVGVQAVVTEFLISNVDLVFSNDNSVFQGMAKRVRPKSLSFGTPTKLLSLEEAQSKKLGSESSHDNYIEVGGGPACLPKIYHTVIELPHRKRLPLKRSPLGWKSLFTRSGSTSLRKSSSTNSGKRKTSASAEISYQRNETLLSKCASETETKSRLRTVKSAESLTSGAGNGASVRNSVCLEYLSPPSPKLPSTSGHSRSVSHDSYFDHLSENTPMHSTIRQDEEGLSDLQVNFDLDESEMKIFSEDSSQMFSNASSSERLHGGLKKKPLLASAENTIIVDPSPKKHKTTDSSSCSSTTLSDDMTAFSNKRSRLEERLLNEDFAYIDSACDRLIVEVDVHHRESSQTSSPMTDTTYSISGPRLSGCTNVSDSSTLANTVAYTPLSDYSCTNSSNYEPSYQPLSSSMSSSQLPRSSTESVRTYDYKRYENLPGNRFSYHGELRVGGSPSARNRLSLQTLTSNLVPEDRYSPIDVVRRNNSNGDIAIVVPKCDVSCSKTELLSERQHETCDNKKSPNDKGVHASDIKTEGSNMISNNNCSNSEVGERLLWKSATAATTVAKIVEEPSATAERHAHYENVPQLDLILDDKDMFSESSSPQSQLNESPYELVTMVGNRMTSVSSTGGDSDVVVFMNEAAKNSTGADSNYEEVRPSSPASKKICSDYEEMLSEYAENEIYNCEGRLTASSFDGKKSAYEVISLISDNVSDIQRMLSSNESLQSSVEDAMIENNLYESLVGEESSPEQTRSNESSKMADSSMTFSSDQCEDLFRYKNIMITSNASQMDTTMETISRDRSPLLVSEIQSPFSDSEQLPQFVGCPTNVVDSMVVSCEKLESSNSNETEMSVQSDSFVPDQVSACSQQSNSRFEEHSVRREQSDPIVPAAERCAESGIAANNDEQNRVDTNGIVSDKKEEADHGDLLQTGHAKSVQDLVSKFEWSSSVEQDFGGRKDQMVLQRSKTISQLVSAAERKEYSSLPPTAVKKTLFNNEPAASVTTTASNDTVEKEDESIRRDRIEKYKEERRQALRQRYQVDETLNDQKDEEMIRRIKQKISKNENGSCNEVQNRLDFDSSPSDDNEQLLAKETNDKPSTAVTTISILYKSKRRQESPEKVSDANVSVGERIRPDGGQNCGTRNSMTFMSKSYNLPEPTKDWSSRNTADSDNRRPFTSSLERKVKSFVRQESLVAKRVNQFAEASGSTELMYRRNGESGSMRRRAHSTSSPIAPYCIRDIAAIFENKDNK